MAQEPPTRVNADLPKSGAQTRRGAANTVWGLLFGWWLGGAFRGLAKHADMRTDFLVMTIVLAVPLLGIATWHLKEQIDGRRLSDEIVTQFELAEAAQRRDVAADFADGIPKNLLYLESMRYLLLWMGWHGSAEVADGAWVGTGAPSVPTIGRYPDGRSYAEVARDEVEMRFAWATGVTHYRSLCERTRMAFGRADEGATAGDGQDEQAVARHAAAARLAMNLDELAQLFDRYNEIDVNSLPDSRRALRGLVEGSGIATSPALAAQLAVEEAAPPPGAVDRASIERRYGLYVESFLLADAVARRIDEIYLRCTEDLGVLASVPPRIGAAAGLGSPWFSVAIVAVAALYLCGAVGALRWVREEGEQ